ncbi:MAG TPA: hypothetical protein VGV60_09490 [Candidatus Polarisedimenticolia bacterium]|jgi:hypothetical protein|nr:hypothetical protein [Candidatus Polarisedimenticolia bacterium]
MRRILAATGLLILMVPPALANVCTCTGTCTIASGTNWSGAASCTDASGPDQTTDAIVVASGGSLSWDQTGTRTYDYLWIQPGGTATVTVSPVVMQFDGPPLNIFVREAFFVVGNVGDARGTFVSNGKDLTISWIGTGAGIAMLLGPSMFGGEDDTGTNYTSVTLRGVERASTAVLDYTRGATAPTPDTDMVDCADGVVAPTGGAVGDTIVFTTGKSQDFWYEVTCYPDQCTGAGAPFACCTGAGATTECSATACGGGPCDYQITRNSTGSTPGGVASSASWSSLTMIPGNGGPFRHATPVDSDADGAANGDGTLPAIGDQFVVFKPILIQGGTNPITNGILFHFHGAGVDLRYIEINKGSGQDAENCAGGSGSTVLWDTCARIDSREGAMEFVNVHNFASRQGMWEVSQTDCNTDARPNVPRTYRHFYIHDVDAQVGTTCPGEDENLMGSGINYFMDDPAGTQDGITMDGFHLARWGAGAALGIVPSGAVLRNILWRNVIIHQAPGIAGYGAVHVGLGFGKGGVVVEGAALWDIGADGREGRAIDSNFTSSSSWAVRNGFMVNIDSNLTGGSTPGGAVVSGDRTQDTGGALVSDSYISRIVGGAMYGGRSLFNFIKDVNMEDDATAPCDSSDQRGALHAPVEATGNVVTRSHPLSCTANAVQIKFLSASAFTTQTRRIDSNLLYNMDTDGVTRLSCLLLQAEDVPVNRDVDFYNNVCDLNDYDGGPDTFGLLAIGTVSSRTRAYCNIFRGVSQTSSTGFTGLTVRDQGCNRFDRTKRNRWGRALGSLRVGIQSFRWFHPAVIPLMDADAFTNYDWRAWSGG